MISGTEWEKRTLAECTEIISGGTPKTSVDEYWDGEICWATPKDLSELSSPYISNTPRKVTQLGLEKSSANILPEGSVLFSSRAPIGHVAINTVPMATNQGFKSFIPDADVLDAKFLYWWLRSHRARLEALGNGATFKEVSKAVVSKVRLPLPPLEEQKRIAEVLDRAEALRARRRAALSLLDELTQSIFLDMFGDPVTNPMGYDQETLKELTHNITDGKHGDCKPSANSGFYFVSVKDIKNGKIEYSNARQIDEQDFQEVHRRTQLEPEDVLITNSGTIGRTAIVPDLDETRRTTFQKSVAILKPKRNVWTLAISNTHWISLSIISRSVHQVHLKRTYCSVSSARSKYAFPHCNNSMSSKAESNRLTLFACSMI